MVDVRTQQLAGRNGADDWPAQAAETIERVVGTVRDKTTGPALTVSRGVVYGLFAGIVGIACLVLVLVATVRLLDNYLPSAVFGEDHMWAVHGLIGLVLTVAGLVLWAKRKPAQEETSPG